MPEDMAGGVGEGAGHGDGGGGGHEGTGACGGGERRPGGARLATRRDRRAHGTHTTTTANVSTALDNEGHVCAMRRGCSNVALCPVTRGARCAPCVTFRLYGALDSHPFFPSHVASGRCVLSAAAAGALAGVVSAFAEPSRWCAGAVLDVAGCVVGASVAPSSWRIGGCAGCCRGRLTVFAVLAPAQVTAVEGMRRPCALCLPAGVPPSRARPERPAAHTLVRGAGPPRGALRGHVSGELRGGAAERPHRGPHGAGHPHGQGVDLGVLVLDRRVELRVVLLRLSTRASRGEGRSAARDGHATAERRRRRGTPTTCGLGRGPSRGRGIGGGGTGGGGQSYLTSVEWDVSEMEKDNRQYSKYPSRQCPPYGIFIPHPKPGGTSGDRQTVISYQAALIGRAGGGGLA